MEIEITIITTIKETHTISRKQNKRVFWTDYIQYEFYILFFISSNVLIR